MNSYVTEFVQGCIAGAAAALAVDYTRNSLLPDASNLQLHGRFGICRDQLTGQAKVAIALLGITWITRLTHNNESWAPGMVTVRIIGIIVGANLAVLIKKIAHF